LMPPPRSDVRAVLDQRAAAEDAVVAECDALANARLVADNAPCADLRAREDDRAGRYDGPVTEHRRRQRVALRRRAHAERRLLADDGVLEDAHAFAEHRALVD